MKFKMSVDVKEITRQIKSIQSRGKTWENDVQTCTLSIIQHVNKHHETSLVNLLVDSMPAGARVNALRQYITKHGKVVFNEDEQTFEPSRDTAKDFDLAVAEHWTTCLPEPKFRPIDLQAAIDNLVKNAIKAANSDKADLHSIDPATLEALSKLATVK